MRGGTMAATPLDAGDQNIVGTLLVKPDNLSGSVGYPSATDAGNPQPFQAHNTYAAYGGRRRRKTKPLPPLRMRDVGLGSRRARTMRAGAYNRRDWGPPSA